MEGGYVKMWSWKLPLSSAGSKKARVWDCLTTGKHGAQHHGEWLHAHGACRNAVSFSRTRSVSADEPVSAAREHSIPVGVHVTRARVFLSRSHSIPPTKSGIIANLSRLRVRQFSLQGWP